MAPKAAPNIHPTNCKTWNSVIYFSQANVHSDGFGDPSAGSEEKGKALIEAAVEGLVRLLQSYHSDLDVQMRDHQDVTIEPMPFIMTIA